MHSVGCQNLAVLRMQVARDCDGMPSGQANRHHDGLSRACRTVVHGSIRDFHAGQFADHRLKFEDRLKRALRDLGLIRRIRGKEFTSRDEAVDDYGTVIEISTSSEKASVAIAVFA